MTDAVLRTTLYDAHVAAGGRMVPFAGYELPVQYDSVIAECKAVRDHAGMFDVGHMARLRFTGDRVIEFLDWVTTNDVAALEDGRGHYSMLPNPAGGVIDDIIVYRISQTEFRMVVNAANHAKDVAWFNSQNSFGVQMEDNTLQTGMIAVQGPEAAAIVAQLAGTSFEGLPFFGVANFDIAGVSCFAARSGYTGEDGFEIIPSAEGAPAVWAALAGAGVKPCGLAARDALRVEAGLPLYGHELSDDLSPIAAGIGWAISKTKSFIGAEEINRARAEGTPRKIFGVKMNSRRKPVAEGAVLMDGKSVGVVTSAVFSPLLDCGIGFALVDSDRKIGDACEVDLGGKTDTATLAGKRFFKKEKP